MEGVQDACAPSRGSPDVSMLACYLSPLTPCRFAVLRGYASLSPQRHIKSTQLRHGALVAHS
jgi:hypothetical protein